MLGIFNLQLHWAGLGYKATYRDSQPVEFSALSNITFNFVHKTVFLTCELCCYRCTYNNAQL